MQKKDLFKLVTAGVLAASTWGMQAPLHQAATQLQVAAPNDQGQQWQGTGSTNGASSGQQAPASPQGNGGSSTGQKGGDSSGQATQDDSEKHACPGGCPGLDESASKRVNLGNKRKNLHK